jgi:hypothetical protein
MKIVRWIAVTAALCSVTAAAEKQLKQGESEVYNDVVKDLEATNFAKAMLDLDAWRQRYPDSDFMNERSALYIQAYAGANQPTKTLDTASELMAKDLNAAFTGSGVQAGAAQATIIRVLYNAVWAISQIANPTPAELATGDRAAHQLMTYDQPLPGVSAEKWTEVRNDMREKAKATLLYIAMLPGIQAMAKQPPNCPAAESAYSRALANYPDNAAISYELGRALNCEAKAMPEKQSAAVYEFVRAATIDPTLGDPRNDKKKIQTFADNAYVRFHGSEEGLEQLRQQVKQSPLPPADFKIVTAAETAEAKQAEFEKDSPQLALWMKVKGALSGTNGQQYFDSQLKDAAVPQLKGVLVEAKPACQPKELLVAVPLPDAQQPPRAEITLKLDKALSGKPELNMEFQWEGIPSAFASEPFMLTMDAESSRIQGLKTTPCAIAPTTRRPSRKTP